MDDLTVEVAENGFIANEGSRHDMGARGKMWAFESPESLAAFVKEWAEEKCRSNIGKVKE